MCASIEIGCRGRRRCEEGLIHFPELLVLHIPSWGSRHECLQVIRVVLPSLGSHSENYTMAEDLEITGIRCLDAILHEFYNSALIHPNAPKKPRVSQP